MLSPVVRLTGHDGVQVSVIDGSYRLCADATCSANPPFTNVAGSATRDAYVQVALTSAGENLSRTAYLTAGTVTAPFVANSTGHSFASMGISDANLANAMAGVLGSASNWIQCSDVGTGGTETCRGGPSTLVVYTGTSTGATFGGYVQGDLLSYSTCWGTLPGFYFSNAYSRSGYVQGNGGAGMNSISVCNAWHFGALSDITTQNTRATAPGTGYSGGNLAGVNSGDVVYGTVRWYRRR